MQHFSSACFFLSLSLHFLHLICELVTECEATHSKPKMECTKKINIDSVQFDYVAALVQQIGRDAIIRMYYVRLKSRGAMLSQSAKYIG